MALYPSQRWGTRHEFCSYCPVILSFHRRSPSWPPLELFTWSSDTYTEFEKLMPSFTSIFAINMHFYSILVTASLLNSQRWGTIVQFDASASYCISGPYMALNYYGFIDPENPLYSRQPLYSFGLVRYHSQLRVLLFSHVFIAIHSFGCHFYPFFSWSNPYRSASFVIEP